MAKLRSQSLRWPLVVAAIAASVAVLSSVWAQQTPENELKAVFIFHFAQFVRWPDEKLGKPQAPVVIGVLDDEPFGAVLARVIQNEKIGSHPIELRQVSNRDEILACHILYVPRESEQRFRVEKLQDVPILTVGETDRFLLSGGIIAFSPERHHLGLRVNLEAARSASLNINAQLLRVAQVVEVPK